jgi:hypothetical protein
MNIVLHRTKTISIDDTVEERHHNSIGNRPGAIARLEHHIVVLQFFFSFWAAGLCGRGKIARLNTLMFDT